MTWPDLCQLVPDWRGTLPEDGALVEEKRDGWRCLAYRGIDGEHRLWTRNGMPLNGAEHVRKAMLAMERVAGEKLFLDGEIQVSRMMLVNGEIKLRGTLAHTKKWFETEWKWDDRVSDGKLHLFDCLTLSEWQAGGSDVPLYQRKKRLADLWQAAGIDPTVCEPVPDQWCCDAGEVLDMARGIWAAHGEGVVIKAFDSPYRRLRSSDWQKVIQENRAKWERAAWRIAA